MCARHCGGAAELAMRGQDVLSGGEPVEESLYASVMGKRDATCSERLATVWWW
jgi:hypothetical protein